MKGKRKIYNKKKKPLSTVGLEKRFVNSKFKHRSSASVQLLKKQIDFEKQHSYHPKLNEYIANAVEEDDDEETNPLECLINQLKTTAKKEPSYRNANTLAHTSKTKSQEQNYKPKSQSTFSISQGDKVCENKDDIQSSQIPLVACNRFKEHLQQELSGEDVDKLIDGGVKKVQETFDWPELGHLFVESYSFTTSSSSSINGKQDTICPKRYPKLLKTTNDLESIGIQPSLAKKVAIPLSNVQSELYAIINLYKDLYFPYRTLDNGEQIRFIYTLHAFNHILKTRTTVMTNNKKIEDEKKKQTVIVDDNCRDQGLARPKVLILVPFRDSALRIVNIIVNIIKNKIANTDTMDANQMDNDQKTVMHYERFVNEFSGDTIRFPKTNPKPVDYERTFGGNTDDNFRLGLSLTKKTVKLYTDFYHSDILIASPLGLRITIGGAGTGDGTTDTDMDRDFLSSIEVLIVDQAETIFAQNWENLLHVLEHMHLQPKDLRNTDINRVRNWCLNGLSKFYRQSLIFASYDLPEFRGVFHNKCFNYEGRIRISNPVIEGAVNNIIVGVSQVFHRIDITDMEEIFQMRFNYFINKILPQFKSPLFAHTMIYVPNYLDYVQLRNYLTAENLSFVQICEYTKTKNVAAARDLFYHSSAHFLLYSERSHYFKRTRIKGIRHIIMYQPPLHPHFYSEIINFMHDSNQNSQDGLEDSMSITILYTKYDILQLNAILGSENAATLLHSDKNLHVYAAL